jgi:hypothetical protein
VGLPTPIAGSKHKTRRRCTVVVPGIDGTDRVEQVDDMAHVDNRCISGRFRVCTSVL